jgi:hypothetical protein
MTMTAFTPDEMSFLHTHAPQTAMALFVIENELTGVRERFAAAETDDFREQFASRIGLLESRLVEVLEEAKVALAAAGYSPEQATPPAPTPDPARVTAKEWLEGKVAAAVQQFHAAHSQEEQERIGEELVNLERELLAFNKPAAAKAGDVRGDVPAIVSPC